MTLIRLFFIGTLIYSGFFGIGRNKGLLGFLGKCLPLYVIINNDTNKMKSLT